MKNLTHINGMGILLTVLALVLFSCTKEENDVTPAVAQLWSEAAPHQPTAPDLREKINSNMMIGGYTSNLLPNPEFEGFDDPALIGRINQELAANGLPEERIQALLSYLEDPDFQYKCDREPNTARLLLTTVTHSNEAVRQVSEETFSMLLQNLNRLIITDTPPPGAPGGSSFTTINRRVYSQGRIFNGSNGQDVRSEWFNEAAELSYLAAGISPPSQNAQILQIVLQCLYIMHDYGSLLEGPQSGNIANAGLRNNLAWLFLSLYRPSRSQEALLVDHYFKHADALTPVDNPSTTDFDESEVNTMNELVERLRQTGYSELPDLPAQPVPDWLARQYEFLTGIPMPNGPVADQTAIERAIAACNTFLDYRPEVRAFVQDYYGVAFP